VPAGLVEYLSLTPAQRQADYRTRVEKAAHDRPEDVAAQLAYLKLLLSEQKVEGAAAAAKRLAALKPPQTALSDGAHALMEAKQYLLARDFFEKAAAAGPHPADVDLGLALAEFRANGAKAGLELLARVPGADRKGDYYMARAQMLEAQGKTQDVISSIGESLRTEPQRPDLYREAIALLAKPGREAEALRITADGARRMPDNREAQLLRATTLEFARHSEDAERLFAEIQDRWPEWSAVWAAHGMVLASHRNYKEAQQALETAVALGADVPEVHFFLAEAYAASGKKQESAAERAKAPAGGTQADYMGRLFRGEIVISR
jgi:tetratricopeptide (TPR) repeat protein